MRCIFRSIRLLDGSIELRLDDRQHTFNPRPFFLSNLVRRIGCVLDRFNSDFNGSFVGLRQLLNHEFESVKTFLSGEHSCCTRKRLVVPLRACLRQDVLSLVTILVRTTLFLTDVCLVECWFTLNEFGHDTGYSPIVNRRTQSPSRLREVHLRWRWIPTSRNRAHCYIVEQKLSVTVQLQPVKVEFFERLQASSLNQVSSFIIFFTRASWAGLVNNRTLLDHKSD